MSAERASIDPLDDGNGSFSSWSTVERLGAVAEPGVRDVSVAEAWSEVPTADLRDVNQGPLPAHPVPQRPAEPSVAPRARRKSQRNRPFAIFRLFARLWIPLLIVVVIGAGGLTVSRLHSVFGAEKGPLYANAQTNDTKRFEPKRLTYEVFGPPGTVATISYFDANANPQRVVGAHLPWSVTFATTEATAVEDIAAQGGSDTLGCRILMDGVVKAERVSHEVSAFVACSQKDV